MPEREGPQQHCLIIASKRGISAILTFLGEFEIVTTGFAIVDFQSQLLIMKGEICSSDVMKAIKQSVAGGKISPELKQFV